VPETLRPVADAGAEGWTVVPPGPVWSAVDDDPDAPDLGDYAEFTSLHGKVLNLFVQPPSALPSSATLRIYADRLIHGARLLEARLTAAGGGQWASGTYFPDHIVGEGLYTFPLWVTPGSYDFSAPSILMLVFARRNETIGGTDVRLYALELVVEVDGGGGGGGGGGTGGQVGPQAAFFLHLSAFP
jgi:hypothetical protein